MQARDFAARQQRARRVVGIGEEDEPRPGAGAGDEFIDVRRPVALVRDDRGSAGGPDRDRVGDEAELAVERFVAGFQKRLRQQADELVGAVAADEARGIEVVMLADRLPQRLRGAVRVKRQRAGGVAKRLHGLRRRAERRFRWRKACRSCRPRRAQLLPGT